LIAIVERAYDAGVNFFDTWNDCNEGQSETFLGHAIKRLPARHKVAISSKVHFLIDANAGPNEQSNSRVDIIGTCEESLKAQPYPADSTWSPVAFVSAGAENIGSHQIDTRTADRANLCASAPAAPCDISVIFRYAICA
jgi:aldo/keto reductase family protein